MSDFKLLHRQRNVMRSWLADIITDNSTVELYGLTDAIVSLFVFPFMQKAVLLYSGLMRKALHPQTVLSYCRAGFSNLSRYVDVLQRL